MDYTAYLSLVLFFTFCLIIGRLFSWLLWNVGYKRLYKKVSFKRQKVDESLQSLNRAYEKYKGVRVDSIKVVFENGVAKTTFFGAACDEIINTIKTYETLDEAEKQRLNEVVQSIIENRNANGSVI
ncbi:hypothetical protein ON011_003286 [Providencia rettgeri]|nr:hypothetical protein [Providencia rettgeri]